MNDKQESNDLYDRLNKLRSALYKVVTENKYDFSSNIFHILGIEHREVPITSYLAYLLDPRASHGQGILFLEEFLKRDTDVQKIENVNLNDTGVYTEYVISNNRRIDILLVNPKFVRIIEVKIYAKDQEHQLYDYVKYFNGYDGVKAIYLTLDGHKPSDDSKSRNDDELKEGDDYICLSFKDDVMRLLNQYECNCDNQGLNQFDYNFQQFKEDVKYMTAINTEKQNEAIAKFIFQDSKNFEIALIIHNYFNDVNSMNLNDEVHVALKNAFSKNWSNFFTESKYGDSNNAVFKCTESDDLFFSIAKSEKDEPFCIGFVNVKEGKLTDIDKNTILPAALQNIKNLTINKSGFWHIWRYIPSRQDKEIKDPIFKDNILNDKAITILDDKGQYIIDCLNSINDFLKTFQLNIDDQNIEVDLSDSSLLSFNKQNAD